MVWWSLVDKPVPVVAKQGGAAEGVLGGWESGRGHIPACLNATY
jgi:hypothetical protein